MYCMWKLFLLVQPKAGVTNPICKYVLPYYATLLFRNFVPIKPFFFTLLVALRSKQVGDPCPKDSLNKIRTLLPIWAREPEYKLQTNPQSSFENLLRNMKRCGTGLHYFAFELSSLSIWSDIKMLIKMPHPRNFSSSSQFQSTFTSLSKVYNKHNCLLRCRAESRSCLPGVTGHYL